MKASELITKLQDSIEKHGDSEVVVTAHDHDETESYLVKDLTPMEMMSDKSKEYELFFDLCYEEESISSSHYRHYG